MVALGVSNLDSITDEQLNIIEEANRLHRSILHNADLQLKSLEMEIERYKILLKLIELTNKRTNI